jgi:hypothetical protein
MDIGTVLKKLRSTPRGYSQPLEVAQDMRQVRGDSGPALSPAACVAMFSPKQTMGLLYCYRIEA